MAQDHKVTLKPPLNEMILSVACGGWCMLISLIVVVSSLPFLSLMPVKGFAARLALNIGWVFYFLVIAYASASFIYCAVTRRVLIDSKGITAIGSAFPFLRKYEKLIEWNRIIKVYTGFNRRRQPLLALELDNGQSIRLDRSYHFWYSSILGAIKDHVSPDSIKDESEYPPKASEVSLLKYQQ